MDINNTPQTGKTTFSVEANGTTQSDIEKNLHTTISDTLANIEETIVYDILNLIAKKVNKYIDGRSIGVEKQDSSIVIYLDRSILTNGLVKNIQINLYTINFPIQFPIQITENLSSNPVVTSDPQVENALLNNFPKNIFFPEISKIVIN